MRRKMRKILPAAMLVILTALWGAGFHAVNQNVDLPVIQVFPKGEEAALEQDFFNYADEEMDGYTVTVLDAEVQTAEKFLRQAGAENAGDWVKNGL